MAPTVAVGTAVLAASLCTRFDTVVWFAAVVRLGVIGRFGSLWDPPLVLWQVPVTWPATGVRTGCRLQVRPRQDGWGGYYLPDLSIYQRQRHLSGGENGTACAEARHGHSEDPDDRVGVGAGAALHWKNQVFH